MLAIKVREAVEEDAPMVVQLMESPFHFESVFGWI